MVPSRSQGSFLGTPMSSCPTKISLNFPIQVAVYLETQVDNTDANMYSRL